MDMQTNQQAMEQHQIREREMRRALVDARAAELERAASEITDTRLARWLLERAKAVRLVRDE